LKRNKLVILFMLLLTIVIFSEENKKELDLKKSNNIIKKIKRYYGTDDVSTSRTFFFPYYASETGLTFGNFYYNTNLFNKGGFITNVIMYSPSTDIGVDWMELKDIPVFGKYKIGGDLFWASFDEIRLYDRGNDSSKNAFTLENMAGYDNGHGKYTNLNLNLKKELNDYDYYKYLFNYSELGMDSKILQRRIKLKTDKIGFEIGRDKTFNRDRAMTGEKIAFIFEKSLNLISNDSSNDRDYYKLKFDARKYIPVGEKKTLAIRFLTMHMDYLKEPDKNMRDFDFATLGDLGLFRGYYFMRYKDYNSAVWQMEYRFPINKKNNIRGSFFTEFGRVSGKYDAQMFYKDLKLDGGFGLHYYFNDLVMVRADLAICNEQTQLRISTSQAF